MTAGLRPEILQDAKNLILRGWCKGELALDEGGRPVGQNTREACAWCLVGAISAAMQRAGIGVLSLVGLAHWDAVSRAIHGRPGKGCGIAWWQDRPERTRDEVVAVLDKLLTWARRRRRLPDMQRSRERQG